MALELDHAPQGGGRFQRHSALIDHLWGFDGNVERVFRGGYSDNDREPLIDSGSSLPRSFKPTTHGRRACRVFSDLSWDSFYLFKKLFLSDLLRRNLYGSETRR